MIKYRVHHYLLFGTTILALILLNRIASRPVQAAAQAQPALPLQATEVEAFMDGLIDAQLEAYHLPGATVAVVQSGGYVHVPDHNPPHFHVRARGLQAQIDLVTFEVLRGTLNPPDQRKVLAWARKRQNELQRNWERIEAYLPPEEIKP